MKMQDYSELYLDARLAIDNVHRLCLVRDFVGAEKAASAAIEIISELKGIVNGSGNSRVASS